jgi:cholesterol oxidase
MAAMTRRAFLAGTAATAGMASLAMQTGAGAARRNRIPLTREDHRVVVIGSGFGGGVTALRFAQAGVPVTVLERGIWWPTGPNADTFPTAEHLDNRSAWLQPSPTILPTPVPRWQPYTGLLERVKGVGKDIMCAAGVGGGSLVYQGMTLQPAENVFNSTALESLDYGRMSSVYYPRVAQMLQVETIPDELLDNDAYRAARIFGSHVTAAGYPLSKIPMPIDWTYAERELRGEMKPSYTNGDLAMGVNNGGKHSVDVTYLAAAQATGLVTVATLHHVTDVAMAKDGRWQVFVDRIDTTGKVLEQKIITANGLVMAAGQANTTRLLMRAQAKQLVPDLPDGLGTNWGSNADRIYAWTNPLEDFGATQGGPVALGSKSWDVPETANTIIQASIPPVGTDLRTTMIVGYGNSVGRGQFVYDPSTDDAVLHFPDGADDAVLQVIRDRMHHIVGPFAGLVDTTAIDDTTWHPLGGASMGIVCDDVGRVLGHRGLYVLDGALMPGTTAACNPSMTIAAVAERATDVLVSQDAGTVF